MHRVELLPTLTLRLSPALAHRAALRGGRSGGGRRGDGRRGNSSSISYTAPSTCRDALCRYNLCPLGSASNPCSEGTWLGKKTDLLLCSCLELQETPGIWACPCSRPALCIRTPHAHVHTSVYACAPPLENEIVGISLSPVSLTAAQSGSVLKCVHITDVRHSRALVATRVL